MERDFMDLSSKEPLAVVKELITVFDSEMERDFMDLSLKEPLAVVEEMNDDGCKDSGFTKGSVVQWPFSNKVSALPNLMSFKISQDDKTKNMVSDPITSTGFMTILSPDAFDSSQKRSPGEPLAASPFRKRIW